MEVSQLIFSVILTLVGSLWGYFLTKYLDRISLPKINVSRRKIISGKWVGLYVQKESINRKNIDIPIELYLKAGRRRISGTMIVNDLSSFEFNLEGSFYHNKYLRLSYTAHGETEHVIDFGSLFLVLNDFGNKMSGNLAGYGSLSESLISGCIELKRA